jgi:hypothetical protein
VAEDNFARVEELIEEPRFRAMKTEQQADMIRRVLLADVPSFRAKSEPEQRAIVAAIIRERITFPQELEGGAPSPFADPTLLPLLAIPGAPAVFGASIPAKMAAEAAITGPAVTAAEAAVKAVEERTLPSPVDLLTNLAASAAAFGLFRGGIEVGAAALRRVFGRFFSDVARAAREAARITGDTFQQSANRLARMLGEERLTGEEAVLASELLRNPRVRTSPVGEALEQKLAGIRQAQTGDVSLPPVETPTTPPAATPPPPEVKVTTPAERPPLPIQTAVQPFERELSDIQKAASEGRLIDAHEMLFALRRRAKDFESIIGTQEEAGLLLEMIEDIRKTMRVPVRRVDPTTRRPTDEILTLEGVVDNTAFVTGPGRQLRPSIENARDNLIVVQEAPGVAPPKTAEVSQAPPGVARVTTRVQELTSGELDAAARAEAIHVDVLPPVRVIASVENVGTVETAEALAREIAAREGGRVPEVVRARDGTFDVIFTQGNTPAERRFRTMARIHASQHGILDVTGRYPTYSGLTISRHRELGKAFGLSDEEIDIFTNILNRRFAEMKARGIRRIDAERLAGALPEAEAAAIFKQKGAKEIEPTPLPTISPSTLRQIQSVGAQEPDAIAKERLQRKLVQAISPQEQAEIETAIREIDAIIEPITRVPRSVEMTREEAEAVNVLVDKFKQRFGRNVTSTERHEIIDFVIRRNTDTFNYAGDLIERNAKITPTAAEVRGMEAPSPPAEVRPANEDVLKRLAAEKGVTVEIADRITIRYPGQNRISSYPRDNIESAINELTQIKGRVEPPMSVTEKARQVGVSVQPSPLNPRQKAIQLLGRTIADRLNDEEVAFVIDAFTAPLGSISTERPMMEREAFKRLYQKFVGIDMDTIVENWGVASRFDQEQVLRAAANVHLPPAIPGEPVFGRIVWEEMIGKRPGILGNFADGPYVLRRLGFPEWYVRFLESEMSLMVSHLSAEKRKFFPIIETMNKHLGPRLAFRYIEGRPDAIEAFGKLSDEAKRQVEQAADDYRLLMRKWVPLINYWRALKGLPPVRESDNYIHHVISDVAYARLMGLTHEEAAARGIPVHILQALHGIQKKEFNIMSIIDRKQFLVEPIQDIGRATDAYLNEVIGKIHRDRILSVATEIDRELMRRIRGSADVPPQDLIGAQKYHRWYIDNQVSGLPSETEIAMNQTFSAFLRGIGQALKRLGIAKTEQVEFVNGVVDDVKVPYFHDTERPFSVFESAFKRWGYRGTIGLSVGTGLLNLTQINLAFPFLRGPIRSHADMLGQWMATLGRIFSPRVWRAMRDRGITQDVEQLFHEPTLGSDTLGRAAKWVDDILFVVMKATEFTNRVGAMRAKLANIYKHASRESLEKMTSAEFVNEALAQADAVSNIVNFRYGKGFQARAQSVPPIDLLVFMLNTFALKQMQLFASIWRRDMSARMRELRTAVTDPQLIAFFERHSGADRRQLFGYALWAGALSALAYATVGTTLLLKGLIAGQAPANQALTATLNLVDALLAGDIDRFNRRKDEWWRAVSAFMPPIPMVRRFVRSSEAESLRPLLSLPLTEEQAARVRKRAREQSLKIGTP